MKYLKTFTIAMAIMISGSTFAISGTTLVEDKTSHSYEMAKLLRDSSLVLEEDLFGKILFSVSAEKEVIIHTVLSKEEFVREYLQEQLEEKTLSGKDWVVGQTYILPVKLKCKK